MAHYTLVCKKIEPAEVKGKHQPDVFTGSLLKDNHNSCVHVSIQRK